MARETKLGIALMVLLVGVFGFMVYKKWNSRQPTALAAAAEATPAAADDQPADPTAGAGNAAEPGKAPDATASQAATLAGAATSNPFVQTDAPASIPPHQQEPESASFEEPFVREATDRTAATMTAVADAHATLPVQQSEPAAGPSDPAFAELTESPAAEGASPFADAEISASTPPADSALPESPAAPAVSPDPFSSVASTGTKAAERPPAQPDVAILEPDDPFGDASVTAESASDDSAAVATSDMPSQPAEGGVPTSPASETAAVPQSGIPLESALDSEEDFASREKPMPVASNAEQATDPFSEPHAAAATLSKPEVEPGRLFADDADLGRATDPIETGAGSESSFVQRDSAAQAAGRIVPTGQAVRPGYIVVAENDSYWGISKRVYGTSAYFHALAKFNSSRIADPNRLKPGMKVLTPEPSELKSLFPNLISGTATGDAVAEGTKSGLSWDAQGSPVYRVSDSDTLTSIAQSHLGRASRWVQIYEMNRTVVPNPKTLKPGTVLRLPADASRVRLVPEG